MHRMLQVAIGMAWCLSMCATACADEKSDAEAREQIKQLLERVDAAFNRGDAKGVAAGYAENAQIYPPNLPIYKGREGVEKFNQTMLDLGFKGMESTLTEIEVFGDVAFAGGTMKAWGPDKSKAGDGKFVLLLKKVDGQWLIYRDCGNSSEPATFKF